MFLDVGPGKIQLSQCSPALNTSLDAAGPLLQPFLYDEFKIIPQEEKTQKYCGVRVDSRQVIHEGPVHWKDQRGHFEEWERDEVR